MRRDRFRQAAGTLALGYHGAVEGLHEPCDCLEVGGVGRLPWMNSVLRLVAAIVLTAASVTLGQVEERATEEIMPGIRVRGGTAVVMDVGPRGCDPPCSGEQACRYDCRETACEADAPPRSKCSRCDWRCVE